jgi:hypothetical protein
MLPHMGTDTLHHRHVDTQGHTKLNRLWHTYTNTDICMGSHTYMSTHMHIGTHPHLYMDTDAHVDPGTLMVRQEYRNLHTQTETHQWTEATHRLRYTYMEREAYMDTDTSRMNTHAQEHKNTG